MALTLAERRKKRAMEARGSDRARDRKARREGGGKVYNQKELIKAAGDEAVRVTEEQKKMNNVNEVNPYGTSTYATDAAGNTTRTSTLSPEQQKILDATQARELSTNAAASAALNRFNTTGELSTDGLQVVDPQNDETRRRVEDAFYARQKRLMDPEFQRQADAETANLRARGYAFNDPSSQNIYDRRVVDPQMRARQEALDAAVLSGGVEADRMFNNQASLRDQQFGERQVMRNQPLNEFAALTGMSAGVTNPQFSAYNPAQVQGVDVAGIGTNFANMENQRKMQASDQRFQRSLPRGGGGGGGESFDDWANKQLFLSKIRQEEAGVGAELDARNRPPAAKEPSPWGGVVSGFGQGIGSILGNLGSSLFKGAI